MKSFAFLLALALPAFTTACGRHAVFDVGPEQNLAAALAGAPDRSTVRLSEGRYHLEGPGIRGKSINVTGAGMMRTIIETESEGGIHFADSLYSALQDLTVNAVTVERGQLTLVGVRVDGGGTAVAGKDGSRLIIRNSEITGGHTVGVRLGAGSAGTLDGALIRRSDPAGGLGLEITAQARASVLNTVISGHAKALSISPDAHVEIHGNLIEGADVSGYEDGGPAWRIDDNIFWTAGTTPDETTRQRGCGNLPGLPYGRNSAFYGAFCKGHPGAG